MTEFKQRFLIWSIVVLVVLNIATLATIIIQKYCNNDSIQNQCDYRRPFDGRGGFHGQRFIEELKLTDEQRIEFDKFNPEFRQFVKSKREVLADLRGEMMTEMKQEQPDTLKISAIAEKIGTIHKEIKMTTFRYYLNLKKICTKDQIETLDSLFLNKMMSDMPGRIEKFRNCDRWGDGPRCRRDGKRADQCRRFNDQNIDNQPID